jgi:hypothetical protein
VKIRFISLDHFIMPQSVAAVRPERVSANFTCRFLVRFDPVFSIKWESERIFFASLQRRNWELFTVFFVNFLTAD